MLHWRISEGERVRRWVLTCARVSSETGSCKGFENEGVEEEGAAESAIAIFTQLSERVC